MKRHALYAVTAACSLAAAVFLLPSAGLVYTAVRYSLSASSAQGERSSSQWTAGADTARSSASAQDAAAEDSVTPFSDDPASTGSHALAADGDFDEQRDREALRNALAAADADSVNASEGVADEEADDAEEEWFSISGWVQDEGGEPVSGLDVTVSAREIFASDEAYAHGAVLDRLTRTDGQGFFSFSDLSDGIYDVRTEPTERYSAARARLRAGEGAAVLVVKQDEVLVTLVFGAVSSTAGEPIAGARVIAVGQPGTSTDDEGYYELEIESSAERRDYMLRFIHRGYREERRVLPAFELRASEELRRDAALEPKEELAKVQGRVTGREGSPVSGATVELASARLTQRYRAVTERDGRFLIPDLEVGSDYRLWVRARPDYHDHVQAGIRVDAAGLDLPVALEGLGRATLAGRMVDAQGRALPGESLWLRSAYGADRGRLLTSDREGRFVAEDLPEGPLALQSRAAPHLSVNGIQMPSEGTRDAQLVLDVGVHSLAGQVVDDRGAPVSGSEVSLAWMHTVAGVTSQSQRNTFADAEGRFLFTRLGPGSHRLDARAAEHRSARLTADVEASAPEVVVRLVAIGR